MKIKFNLSIFVIIIFSFITACAQKSQEIPIKFLSMELEPNQQKQKLNILKNEIEGVTSEHITITSDINQKVDIDEKHKTIYLFIKGYGKLTSGEKIYDIVPETIMLPNTVEGIWFKPIENDTLHYLKISVFQTELDIEDIKTFPKENTENIYFKKFTDCKSYTEPIKSPQTTSRTILPNKYIPRVAMGTVKTIGPDKVGAHVHAMLEQLFFGLAGNQTIVYADDAQVDFPEYSLLHIPLGSSHSVSVNENNEMYYVWMDFFVDKDGEEWLKTHNTKDE
ncbi:cupin domain-containing protein [Sabulilitoribacter multivorans]|uniref:Cupin domain-containing protein n=1 Tax=Flaviramulus multivorans TaxID=1304750 RepID=A0ABS9IFM5_9FLAO|nr:cupin domain-containing protein [Flaviramulus multivorans]MCF7559205.1 cupin domain-containing protein [Flaviramulus multivorans]